MSSQNQGSQLFDNESTKAINCYFQQSRRPAVYLPTQEDETREQG